MFNLDINNKIIKRIGKSRTDLFEENEKKFLEVLPVNRFIYKELKIASVNIDYHVELNRSFYSVPFKYLKEKYKMDEANDNLDSYMIKFQHPYHPIDDMQMTCWFVLLCAFMDMKREPL